MHEFHVTYLCISTQNEAVQFLINGTRVRICPSCDAECQSPAISGDESGPAIAARGEVEVWCHFILWLLKA